MSDTLTEHLGHYAKYEGEGDYLTRFTCLECDVVVEFDRPGFFTRLILRVTRR
jgi:hypothetical protein